MATPGNDPFSATGPNPPNLLNHVFSPKIVWDSTTYDTKLDLINVDNIYLTGSAIGPTGTLVSATGMQNYGDYLFWNGNRWVVGDAKVSMSKATLSPL